MNRLAWHFDFHSHGSVRIGHDPDVEGVAAALAAAGVEEIITFAKCHTGFAYYPTRIGTPHPRMRGDAFGDVLRACRARDIRVLAYVSFGIDGEAARRHPQWSRYHAPGKAEINDDHYIDVCPFTDYTEAFFLPQVREIIERYSPDGFFFDTMAAFGVCYCDACRAAFETACGCEIPVTENDPGWDLYGRFRHDRAMALIDRVGAAIAVLAPEAVIGFNQVGSPPQPEQMPASITRLTLDFCTSGPQSLQSSLCASFGSTAALPADIMPTRFNQGWGDWSPAPAAALEQVAAPILAHGARLYMGDRLHPGNRLTEGTKQALQILQRLWRNMAAELPPAAAQRAPDAILLHSPSLVYGEDMSCFAREARIRLAPLEGAHRLLLDAGWNFAIAAETYLPAWLQPERLLVIPEIPALSPQTDALIREHLAQGGRVLVVGRLPTVDGIPVDWLGVREESEPWQDHLYLPALDGHDPAVTLVRGTCHRVIPHNAEPLLQAYPPYDLTFGVRMGWGINPPADKPADSPVLTRHARGAGAAFYLGCPLFSDYVAGINLGQKAWFEQLLNHVAPLPAQQLLSPAGSVELITYSGVDATWAVLVNHGGETLSSGTARRDNWPRTVSPLPPFPVTLVSRPTRNGPTPTVTCAGKPLPSSVINGTTHVEFQMDTLWKVLKLQ